MFHLLPLKPRGDFSSFDAVWVATALMHEDGRRTPDLKHVTVDESATSSAISFSYRPAKVSGAIIE